MAKLSMYLVQALTESRLQEIATVIEENNSIKITNFIEKNTKVDPLGFWTNISYLYKESIITKIWKGSCREAMVRRLNLIHKINNLKTNYMGVDRSRLRDRIFLSIRLNVPTRFSEMDIVPEARKFCLEIYKKFKSDSSLHNRVENDLYWQCFRISIVDSGGDKLLRIVFPVRETSHTTLFIFYSTLVLLLRSWMFLDKSGKRRNLNSIYSFWGEHIKLRKQGSYHHMNYSANFIMYCVFLFAQSSNMMLSDVLKPGGIIKGPYSYFTEYPKKIVQICDTHNLWNRFHKYAPSTENFPAYFLVKLRETRAKFPAPKIAERN